MKIAALAGGVGGAKLALRLYRAMDPSLEESAMMSGANIFQVAWRITLALSWPAVFATLLILFVRALESFEVPALLGLPVGIQVFTSAIYQAIHHYPSEIGLASSYAVALLLITSLGVYFQSRMSRHGSRYATMTGNSFAAPHMTGIVALILAKHPGLTPFLMKTILRTTAWNVRVPQPAGPATEAQAG